MKFNKREWAYIFYDWAESCFTVIVAAFIFPMLWGLLSKGIPAAESWYGFLVSGVSLTVAALSPILGTIADYHGYKKRFFLFFFVLGIGFTFLMSFYPVDPSFWWMVLIPYTLASIGYAGTNVFYDSFIVDATTDERMDQVSTTGYAFGYIGGSTIPLVLSVVLLQVVPGFATDGFLHVAGLRIPYDVYTGFRCAFVLTAIWWLVFSIPFLKNIKQVHGIPPEPKPIRNAFKRLGKTFTQISHYKVVFLFLAAFFLYIDGVNTIISMAVPFATNAIDTVTEDNATATLLPILLAIQVVAFFFALLFSWLAGKFKPRNLLLFAIGMYACISIYAVFVTQIWHFWILGMMVASCQGAIQSLSRAYFGRIIPKERANEFFGFYTIFGRFAAVIGPALVGGISLLVYHQVGNIPGGTMRFGVLSLIILFVGGGFFFIWSNRAADKKALEAKARADKA